MPPSLDLSPDLIQAFVGAAHGDLARVQELYAQEPRLLTATHYWNDAMPETALEAASHTGQREIAQFLLAAGAPLTICTAAMLGRLDDVQAMLADDPALAQASGAHGISLMFHAALSGDTAITQTLLDAGATEGFNHALHAAASQGHVAMTRWLLDNGADDVNHRDGRGRTPLARAVELGHEAVAAILRTHGGAV